MRLIVVTVFILFGTAARADDPCRSTPLADRKDAILRKWLPKHLLISNQGVAAVKRSREIAEQTLQAIEENRVRDCKKVEEAGAQVTANLNSSLAPSLDSPSDQQCGFYDQMYGAYSASSNRPLKNSLRSFFARPVNDIFPLFVVENSFAQV
ncbi:MAG: hypothetical protein P4M08_13340 [Oligoflexia bacterium]|nr:hypothetical protein [Oligoflexia bacterium]